MKPQRAFVADRVVARHCPELLGTSLPAVPDLLPQVGLFGERLARQLALGLARLTGTDAPTVRTTPPRTATLEQIEQEALRLASYGLLAAGDDGHPVLLTLAAAPVLRLVDRAFGGRGQVPDPLPEAFPLSAELLIGRLEKTVSEALTRSLGDAALTIVPLRRETRLPQLAPFPRAEPVVELTLTVEERGSPPWMLALAFPLGTLVRLFEGREKRRSQAPAMAGKGPGHEPFASIPVTLNAVIVDMAIGFSKLADLKPGDILPVAVARSVPLKAGRRTLAVGTIGEFEDRVAVQLTSAF